MSEQALLTLNSVALKRGDQLVVDHIDANLNRGDWVAVIGPNGAGKSSLLTLMAGLVKPSSGSVELAERDLRAWPAKLRAQQLAWLAQQGESEGDIAARDVVALARLPHSGLTGSLSRTDEQAIDKAMLETQCAQFATRRLNELSGGERQRVLLARALAVEAQVMLLDEPMAHLDAPHQSALIKGINRRANAGTAIAIVLHDLTLALTAKRVWLMDHGRLLMDAAPDNPALHAAMVKVFDNAIVVEKLQRLSAVQHIVLPVL